MTLLFKGTLALSFNALTYQHGLSWALRVHWLTEGHTELNYFLPVGTLAIRQCSSSLCRPFVFGKMEAQSSKDTVYKKKSTVKKTTPIIILLPLERMPNLSMSANSWTTVGSSSAIEVSSDMDDTRLSSGDCTASVGGCCGRCFFWGGSSCCCWLGGVSTNVEVGTSRLGLGDFGAGASTGWK